MCVTVWVLRYKNKKNGDRGTIVFTATLRLQPHRDTSRSLTRAASARFFRVFAASSAATLYAQFESELFVFYFSFFTLVVGEEKKRRGGRYPR